jgi:NAD(P)H-dependent FMN reductase
MPRLLIVIASTRPGRIGLPIGTWFADHARAHGGFGVTVADLAELALPFLDEPGHPRLADYRQDHTRQWSALVDDADAVVFVTPEYNHGYTAPLKNALDFLHREWAHKAAGLVSYGGVSAGLRAATAIKPVLAALGMTVVPAAVSIPFAAQLVGDDGTLAAGDTLTAAADAMLDALLRVDTALRPLRERQPVVAA